MASHQLAIAKASLSAGLLRPDPTSVPRDEITAFHSALDRALSHCSSANIQACKSWLLRHVVSSSNRVGVWAKYLAALSSSFAAEEGASATKSAARPATSAKRKRLHIMYLLNDVFHHTKYHMGSKAAFSTVSGSLQPYIVELLGYAASYDRQKNPKHHRRLDELLDIWEANEYYGSDYVGKLREVVKSSALSGPVKASIDVETSNLDAANKPTGKNMPFVMPATHGDPSTPFYDLPAGNLIPHIIPNSTIPLRPDTIKPLQFLAGPADEKLVKALKAFLKDVDRIYESAQPEPQSGEVVDIDDLGEVVIREDNSGDVLDGETYYGWSRSFCQQMKKRNAKRSSRSRSRSRSLTPHKRRRYGSSVASDDSRLSRSRSRSQTPPRRDRSRKYDSRSRSRSRSRPSKSYSPRRPSPPRAHPPTQHPPNPYGHSQAPAAPAYPPQQQRYAPLPPPPQHPMHFPGGPQGGPPFPPPGMFPQGAPPPPPPQNYQGQWPPPPPPMPNYGHGPGMNTSHFPPPYQAQGGQYPSMHRGPGPGPSQQMPPGSYRFPPPHQGGQGQGQGPGQGQGHYGYPPGRWR